VETDVLLLHWREGQVHSEQLAAQLLAIEGFEDIKPQAPLGGPDGRKDILCTREGTAFVAAVYFPPTVQDEKAVKKKFVHDLEGVAINKAKGFAFLTNQRIPLGQAGDLASLHHGPLEIYDGIRISSILDRPAGFGMRAAFLKKGMSLEDTVAFTTYQTELIARALDKHTQKLSAAFHEAIATRFDPRGFPPPPSAEPDDIPIEVRSILLVHRALLGFPRHPEAGKLRRVRVWIGGPGSTVETARLVPPPPETILDDLSVLAIEFEDKRSELRRSPVPARVRAIVDFHHAFLRIHPFLDGNGRAARLLLEAQLDDLCDLRLKEDPFRGPDYFDALDRADKADDRSRLLDLVMTATTSDGEASASSST
jgi:fido (protein-threonine AMPylation protein)